MRALHGAQPVPRPLLPPACNHTRHSARAAGPFPPPRACLLLRSGKRAAARGAKAVAPTGGPQQPTSQSDRVPAGYLKPLTVPTQKEALRGARARGVPRWLVRPATVPTFASSPPVMHACMPHSLRICTLFAEMGV